MISASTRERNAVEGGEQSRVRPPTTSRIQRCFVSAHHQSSGRYTHRLAFWSTRLALVACHTSGLLFPPSGLLRRDGSAPSINRSTLSVMKAPSCARRTEKARRRCQFLFLFGLEASHFFCAQNPNKIQRIYCSALLFQQGRPSVPPRIAILSDTLLLAPVYPALPVVRFQVSNRPRRKSNEVDSGVSFYVSMSMTATRSRP